MIYVFLANGFEEVEAITPIDYLRRCEELEVKTVGIGGKTITGSHGIPFICDLTDEQIELNGLEMIVLPGGMPGTLNLENSEIVQACLQHCAEQNLYIGAICAAPSILGHVGLLNGKNAVCYPGFEQELVGATVLDQSVCKDGNIITAQGAGAANQFAFKLIEALLGAERANYLKAAVQWKL